VHTLWMLAEILYYRGVNFRRRCWFLGLFVYFTVNFVLIFAEISILHVILCEVEFV